MSFSLTSMRLPIVLAAALAFAPSASEAAQMWTFCVASGPGGGEVWITAPFASSSDRRALEAAMQATLKRHEGERALAQCPQPSADKAAVVDAQQAAVALNRKHGAILHVLPQQDFPEQD